MEFYKPAVSRAKDKKCMLFVLKMARSALFISETADTGSSMIESVSTAISITTTILEDSGTMLDTGKPMT